MNTAEETSAKSPSDNRTQGDRIGQAVDLVNHCTLAAETLPHSGLRSVHPRLMRQKYYKSQWSLKISIKLLLF